MGRQLNDPSTFVAGAVIGFAVGACLAWVVARAGDPRREQAEALTKLVRSLKEADVPALVKQVKDVREEVSDISTATLEIASVQTSLEGVLKHRRNLIQRLLGRRA